MSVSIFLVRALVETVERLGASRADFVARTGLDPRRLDEPETRLEFEEFEQLLASAVAFVGDEALGLHMAEQMADLTFDLLAHVTAHAPTLREAIAVSSQFASLAIDGMHLATRDESGRFTICCAVPRVSPLWDRTFADFMMAGLARLARAFVGPTALPRLVCFEHERPSQYREYARILGPNVRFRESETAIAYDRDLADRRQIRQHPELYSMLQVEAERRLERRATGVRAAVRLRQYLLGIPLSRIPAIATVARHLGMSERSLRRRLADEGTSYRDVVRLARETSAGRLLRDPSRTIKETALALGFADAAAFVNAFKRWTGTTPGAYRRRPRTGS